MITDRVARSFTKVSVLVLWYWHQNESMHSINFYFSINCLRLLVVSIPNAC